MDYILQQEKIGEMAGQGRAPHIRTKIHPSIEEDYGHFCGCPL